MRRVLLLIFIVAEFVVAQTFTKITTGDLVNDAGESEACSWGDYNNDGYLDLFVSNGLLTAKKNFLYMNNGPEDGYSFTKILEGDIVNDTSGSRAASWGDYNNDGYLDLFVGNQQGTDLNSNLYMNNGDGTFLKVTTVEPVNDGPISDGAEWVDYDNDGHLDLFAAVGGSNPNRLYRNNGDGTFARITEGEIVTDMENTLSAAWGDFDNDGDLDLYAVNRGNNSMYVNNGDGTFNKLVVGFHIADATQSNGANWVDFDNDGDLDLFVSNRLDEKNLLYQNMGAGSGFLFVPETTGDLVNDLAKFSSSNWSDFDNDGDLDVFVSNFGGFDFQGWENYLYSNNGDRTFTKIDTGIVVTEKSTTVAGAWGDYDNDGDMDLFVVNTVDADNVLYRNDSGNRNNWLEIQAFGTESNVSAIGAKLRAKATIDGEAVWQLRTISGQTGLLSQNSMIVHFGLGDAEIVDSLIVEWPSGAVDEFIEVDINQRVEVTEGGIITSVKSGRALLPDNYELSQNYPNPFNPETTIRYEVPKAEHLRLRVYNLRGEIVATLVDGQVSAGHHSVTWNGRNHRNERIASGMYLYKLEIDSRALVKKMLLVQ